MRNTFLFLLLLFISLQTNGQFQVQNLPSPDTSQVFPLIQSESRPKAAEKINQFLQLEFLEIAPNPAIKDPFEKVQNDYRAFFEDWEVLETPPTIFSILIQGGGTGNYTTFFTVYLNFDAQTGQALQIKDILSPAGFTHLDHQMMAITKHDISSFVDSLKQIYPPEEDITTQIENYQSCIEREAIGDLDYDNFFIGKDVIHIYRGACFPHVIQALDDIGEMHNTFSIKYLKPFLSDYGRTLLFPESN